MPFSFNGSSSDPKILTKVEATITPTSKRNGFWNFLKDKAWLFCVDWEVEVDVWGFVEELVAGPLVEKPPFDVCTVTTGTPVDGRSVRLGAEPLIGIQPGGVSPCSQGGRAADWEFAGMMF